MSAYIAITGFVETVVGCNTMYASKVGIVSKTMFSEPSLAISKFSEVTVSERGIGRGVRGTSKDCFWIF